MIPDMSKTIRQARCAMRLKDWASACDKWADVRATLPLHPASYIEGIESLIRAYRHDEISAVAALAREHVLHDPNVEMFLAKLACRQGRWAESVQMFEAIVNRGDVTRSTVYRQAVLNAEGILAGNRRLAQLTHADFMQPQLDCLKPVNPGSAFVFVSGMPRAGTTALGHALNRSSGVAIFTEIHIPYLAYDARSFDRRLLDVRMERLPQSAPSSILNRLPDALFLGDKRPLFHYMLPQTLEAMRGHQVSVFHILRPVALVAASYHARAMNPKDEWDPLRNLHNAIDELNVMHRFILDWHAQGEMASGHRLFYVDNTKVFKDLGYLLGLFYEMGHDVNEDLRQRLSNYIEHSREILTRDRPLDEFIQEGILARLDIDLARRVETLTGIELLTGLVP